MQQRWQRELNDQGVDVTPIIDRQCFHLTYFRDPGGAPLEIATTHRGDNAYMPRPAVAWVKKSAGVTCSVVATAVGYQGRPSRVGPRAGWSLCCHSCQSTGVRGSGM
jgi:hypothetical protein